IVAAREAHAEWAAWPWEDRAAVVLKAAELLTTTWRATLNAATMLGQSKTVFQARSEEHTSELQSRFDLVCRLLLEKKNHSAVSRSMPSPAPAAISAPAPCATRSSPKLPPSGRPRAQPARISSLHARTTHSPTRAPH